MNQYPEQDSYGRKKTKAELDLSNYAIKYDLIGASVKIS